MEKIIFNQKICILGFGSIGRATLPLIFKHIDIEPSRITVVSKEIAWRRFLDDVHINCSIETITPKNYQDVLSRYVSEGDMLINLTADVDSIELIKYANSKGILYVDTSLELWPEKLEECAHETTYSYRLPLMQLRKEVPQDSTTALSSHGANPGVVSSLVKEALLRIASCEKIEVQVPTSREEWSQLAQRLGVRVIHVNERDTQRTNTIMGDAFVSTWSVEAMIAEAIQPAEMSLGTHEKELPGEVVSNDTVPRNIYFNKPGKEVSVRTWIPSWGENTGCLITHIESISISEYFADTLNSYAPTVCFVYRPCDATVASLENISVDNYALTKGAVILEEIVEGHDELGVLIMTEYYGSYWLGSKLDIKAARELNPFSSATTLQVASGVLAGVCWVIQNQKKGIIEAEDVDYNFVLKIAEPYWGGFIFEKTNWKPVQGDDNLQFKDFLIG